MRRVLKHALSIETPTRVVLTAGDAGPHVLSVQAQGNEIMIWALHDDTHEPRVCTFRVVLTGEELPPRACVYHGTVLLNGGGFVAHVFEDVG